MDRLDGLYEKYHGKDLGDFGSNEVKVDLRSNLEHMEPDEIRTCGDAERFIVLLSDYRRYTTELVGLVGKGFKDMVQKMLGVGSNGVYFDQYRYIYELIQNVDDCDYPDEGGCGLDIRFDPESNTINLKYNETGFTPHDVFAITGIAEESKNLSDDRIQIGEKGIGFKSVFGVADWVIIRSGLFSFRLRCDDVMAPEPLYGDGFRGVKGTELTAHLHEGRGAAEAFGDLVERYSSEDAIFNMNPVLFLNKLTSLRFSCGEDSLEFTVTRAGGEKTGGISVEEGVCLTARCEGGHIKNFDRKLICHRFCEHVRYAREDFESRYGRDTRLAESGGRDLPVYAVVPDVEYVPRVRCGALYSYMPTQMRLSMPISVHVPFELNSSREYVDPQGENLWYGKSLRAMQSILDATYRRLSDIVAENVVFYIPRSGSGFDSGNPITRRLFADRHVYDRERILRLDIFKTDDGKRNGDAVICIGREKGMNPERARRAFEILRPEERSYFACPENCNPEEYGLTVMTGVKEGVLRKAFEDSKSTENAVGLLSEFDADDLGEVKADVRAKLSRAQIECLMKSEGVCGLLRFNSFNKIKRNGDDPLPLYEADLSTGSDDIRKHIPEIDEGKTGSKTIERYLKMISYTFVAVNLNESAFIAMRNALVLSCGPDGDIGDAFADFCTRLDEKSTFGINRQIDRLMKDVRDAENDASISDYDYLLRLEDKQRLARKVLGNLYDRFIACIIDSGADPNRFIGELLQNADDCAYPEGAVPAFSVKIDGNRIVTESNETGFTRADVAAITEIADSTKTKLLNNENDPIGEKGVGFKTVFSTAESVKISSAGFVFRLTKDAPTVPVPSDVPKTPAAGTKMEFMLNGAFPGGYFTERSVLGLVLCLRKLRKVKLGGFEIRINDDGNMRDIYVNDRRYSFIRLNFPFEVTDAEALRERRELKPGTKAKQRVCCYLYRKNKGNDGEPPRNLLYCGLPTGVEIYNNMYIDAPFQLTTARDRVIENSWNDVILEQVYKAIEKVIVAGGKSSFAAASQFLGIKTVPGGGSKPGSAGYEVSVFSDRFMNDPDWLETLRWLKFMPTFEDGVLVSPRMVGPSADGCRRYPYVVNYLLEKGETLSVPKRRILNVPTDSKYDPIYKALGCEVEKPGSVVAAVTPYIARYLDDKRFRDSLYRYMRDNPSERYRELSVIPVYSKDGESTEYIKWTEGRIFVHETKRSTDDYFVLNEEYLDRKECETALSPLKAVINRLNPAEEKTIYLESLSKKMSCLPPAEAYGYLLDEFGRGNLEAFGADEFITALRAKKLLPLKNAAGDIVTDQLFINSRGSGYFSSSVAISALTIHDECARLAEYAGAKDLSGIHFSDICNPAELKADDVEGFLDGYFRYQVDIIYGYIRKGLISSELIETYDLKKYEDIGIDVDQTGEIIRQDYAFPRDPIGSEESLERHMDRIIENRRRLESRQEYVWVREYNYKGKYYKVDNNEIRSRTLIRYAVDGIAGKMKCVCQRCKKVRWENHIEMRNIEPEPGYVWDDMRMSLCLECSKTYENIRNTGALYNAFIKRLKEADHTLPEPIEIPDGTGGSIGFTQTHLAEIQAILRWEDANENE